MSKPFACPDCNRSFRTQEGLNQHATDTHGAARVYGPFDCTVCGRRCGSALRLNKHMASHGIQHRPVGRRPSLAEIDPICIECGGVGKLVTGDVIYPHRPDLYHKSFYRCACGAYCGCHPNSVVPLGFPCGPATRRARNAAHSSFDPLWKSGKMSRASAYKWLSDSLRIAPGDCHIGMMTAEQAWRVVELCRARKAA